MSLQCNCVVVFKWTAPKIEVDFRQAFLELGTWPLIIRITDQNQ